VKQSVSSWSRRLLEWYLDNRKHLPWRERGGPYRSWIAEVMSQQTTLKVVVPRFERFVEVLPDVEALARCSDSVLRELWAGLGYYARARNLRRGARFVVDEREGVFPCGYRAWLELPGVGPYTAAVLASICCGEPVPCVDGNVIRVVARQRGSRSERVWTGRGRAETESWLGPRIRNVAVPGDFNQAIMELGQEICTRSSPACRACPVASGCRAFAGGFVDDCPPPKPRPSKVRVLLWVLVPVRADGRLGIVERAEGFLAGTRGWCLLRDRRESGGAISSLGELCGCAGGRCEEIGAFDHVITRHRLTCRVVICRGDESPPAAPGGVWYLPAEIPENLSSSLDIKAWRLVFARLGEDLARRSGTRGG
jgi:A/G-specific adenine glycosylase